MTVMEREILTPEQIAGHLQVQQRTIQDWLRSGALPGIKLGRLWRVQREDLEGFLKLRKITSGVAEQQAGKLRDYEAEEIEQMLRIDRLESPHPSL
jgi:excisionase family DNA binding protein